MKTPKLTTWNKIKLVILHFLLITSIVQFIGYLIGKHTPDAWEIGMGLFALILMWINFIISDIKEIYDAK